MSKCSRSQTNLVSNLEADRMVGWLKAPEGVHPNSWDMGKECCSVIKIQTLRGGDSAGEPNLITWVFQSKEPFPAAIRARRLETEKGGELWSIRRTQSAVTGFEEGRLAMSQGSQEGPLIDREQRNRDFIFTPTKNWILTTQMNNNNKNKQTLP